MKPLTVFTKKNSIIYVWEDSNEASLAVSFSFIVNKIIWRNRNRGLRMYFEIGALKNFSQISLEKYMCWSLFLRKLQAVRLANLLKADSNTSISLSNWRDAPALFSIDTYLRQLVFKISNSNILSKDFSRIPVKLNLLSRGTLTMTN